MSCFKGCLAPVKWKLANRTSERKEISGRCIFEECSPVQNHTSATLIPVKHCTSAKLCQCNTVPVQHRTITKLYQCKTVPVQHWYQCASFFTLHHTFTTTTLIHIDNHPLMRTLLTGQVSKWRADTWAEVWSSWKTHQHESAASILHHLNDRQESPNQLLWKDRTSIFLFWYRQPSSNTSNIFLQNPFSGYCVAFHHPLHLYDRMRSFLTYETRV